MSFEGIWEPKLVFYVLAPKVKKNTYDHQLRGSFHALFRWLQFMQTWLARSSQTNKGDQFIFLHLFQGADEPLPAAECLEDLFSEVEYFGFLLT